MKKIILRKVAVSQLSRWEQFLFALLMPWNDRVLVKIPKEKHDER